jgi:hypothetical protein
MGSKSSHFYQADRPESGGSNRKDIKDSSGLHEEDKQKYGAHRAELEAEGMIPERGENPELERLRQSREQSEGDRSREQGSE